MDIKIKVPNGKSGDWSVESFKVSKKAASSFNMGQLFDPVQRPVKAGSYKRLKYGNVLVMSNTSAEIQEHIHFINKARISKGYVLINGLGLGVALKAILNRGTRIKHIEVIEKYQDVINLVAPTYIKDTRVTIIHADAFEYKPIKGRRYCAVWHDIWNDICADNLDEMTRLHRKYRTKTNWQGSWCREVCQRLKRINY